MATKTAAPALKPRQIASPRLNQLTTKYTAFSLFSALLDARGNYFPSLRIVTDPETCRDAGELTELADAYDVAQQARGDPRRALRS